MEKSVLKLKQQGDFITVRLRMTECFGRKATSFGRIEEKAGVITQRCAPADKDDRFIDGLALGVLLPGDFVKADVLVVKHPISFDIVSRVLTGDLALEDPFPGHVIQQGIWTNWLLR